MTAALYRLIDAICETYDQARAPGKPWHPVTDDPKTPNNEAKTFCNFAVRSVAEKMGYLGFGASLANDMVDIMANSGQWLRIPPDTAQDEANGGRLVVAGMQATPHGHVAVVRPGVHVISAKYGCLVPKCMQVGVNVDISRATNWAFPTMPSFYAWRPEAAGQR